jgi:hypothetical protein
LLHGSVSLRQSRRAFHHWLEMSANRRSGDAVSNHEGTIGTHVRSDGETN